MVATKPKLDADIGYWVRIPGAGYIEFAFLYFLCFCACFVCVYLMVGGALHDHIWKPAGSSAF